MLIKAERTLTEAPRCDDTKTDVDLGGTIIKNANNQQFLDSTEFATGMPFQVEN